MLHNLDFVTQIEFCVFVTAYQWQSIVDLAWFVLCQLVIPTIISKCHIYKNFLSHSWMVHTFQGKSCGFAKDSGLSLNTQGACGHFAMIIGQCAMTSSTTLLYNLKS